MRKFFQINNLFSLFSNNDEDNDSYHSVSLMHAIARAHASTCATSLMCIKNSTHHFYFWQVSGLSGPGHHIQPPTTSPMKF